MHYLHEKFGFRLDLNFRLYVFHEQYILAKLFISLERNKEFFFYIVLKNLSAKNFLSKNKPRKSSFFYCVNVILGWFWNFNREIIKMGHWGFKIFIEITLTVGLGSVGRCDAPSFGKLILQFCVYIFGIFWIAL